MADIDGNGLDDLGGGGGLSGGGGAASSAHLTVHKEVTIGLTSARKVDTWQGSFDELLAKAKTFDFANTVEDPDLPEGSSDTSGEAWGMPRIIDAKIVRETGGICRLTVVKVQNRHVAHISIDFTEVQRPIKTWHADKESGAPDLAAIREWEAKEETDYANYAAFTGLSGDTKTLAEMIVKGVEHYSVYRPVVTITLTTDDAPQLSLYPIGGVFTEGPSIPYGWTDIHGKTVADLIAGDYENYMWVLGASRATPNADGTYQWVLQYQACDSVEEALFGGGDGGGQTENTDGGET
jgi:hypothetical protein